MVVLGLSVGYGVNGKDVSLEEYLDGAAGVGELVGIQEESGYSRRLRPAVGSLGGAYLPRPRRGPR